MRRLSRGIRQARRNACRTLVLVLLVSLLPANGTAGTFYARTSREARRVRNQIRAAQFLAKATFGPTREEVDALAQRMAQLGVTEACEEWVDRQFDLPATSHKQTALRIAAVDGIEPTDPEGRVDRYRYQAWWHIALTADDQLRQRVGYALSQIFVIGHSGAGFNSHGISRSDGVSYTEPHWLGMSDYYDMLAGHAFGNYRALLGDVTFHPCMGVWLSHVRNRKADLSVGRYPDENYAREILQLFSIGVHELEQDGSYRTTAEGELIPTYDNEAVETLARLFTGFRYAHPSGDSLYTLPNLTEPMTIRHEEHDDNRDYSLDPAAPQEKRIFGVRLPPLPDPLTDRACVEEIDAGLDVIAEHENVAPFICRQLIQRLVKSNPSRAYLSRVTAVFNDNGQGARGDLRAVVKAILLDPELFRGQRIIRRRRPSRVIVIPRGTETSRLREPVLRVTALIRALKPSCEAAPGSTVNYAPHGLMMLPVGIEQDLGQHPYRAPSVFNFYRPDYQPAGELAAYRPSARNPYDELHAPEFQILHGVTSNRMINRLRSIARNRNVQFRLFGRNGVDLQCRIAFDLDDELELASSLDTMPVLIRRFDLLLCNGTLSDESQQSILQAVTDLTKDSRHSRVAEYRLEQTLLAVLLSPDCAIEE